MGGQHRHAEITFQDGLEGVASFPLVASGSSAPRDIRDHILRSKAATLPYLGRHTTVPVPQVFNYVGMRIRSG